MPKRVVNNAVTVCSKGTMPSVLLVGDEHDWVIENENTANVGDHVPITNIVPFGLCKSMANPAVAAAQGTPQPCIPITPMEWSPGEKSVILDKHKALHDQSICPCVWKGIIAITDAGQDSWFIGHEIPKDKKEENKKQASEAVEKYKTSDEGKKTIADTKAKAQESAVKQAEAQKPQSKAEANSTTASNSANTPAEKQEHWIQAQYLDADNKPITGVFYTIKHNVDGSLHPGTLDAQGKTQRLTNIQPGTATITFGEKQKLEAHLNQYRNQLKAHLDAMLEKIKAAAAKEHAQYAKYPWYEKNFIYNAAVDKNLVEGLGKGAVEGTWGAIKGAAHVLFEGAKLQGLEQAMNSAIISGNTAEYNELEKQYQQLIAADTAWLTKAKKFVEQLYRDSKTRDLLENFAKEYVESETPLMIAKQTGKFVGGLIPGIIIAVVTGQPEVAVIGESTEAIEDVTAAASTTEKIDDTLNDLEKCQELNAAAIDNEHIVKSEEPAEEVPVEIINQRIDKAFDFYKNSGMPADKIEDHLNGIDFTKPVTLENLTKNKILQQWQVPGNWQGDYYSKIGETPTRLGINPLGKKRGIDIILKRKANFYKLTEDVSALKSTANNVLDDFSIPEKTLPNRRWRNSIFYS